MSYEVTEAYPPTFIHNLYQVGWEQMQANVFVSRLDQLASQEFIIFYPNPDALSVGDVQGAVEVLEKRHSTKVMFAGSLDYAVAIKKADGLRRYNCWLAGQPDRASSQSAGIVV